MKKVEFYGWNVGARMLRFAMLLRNHAGVDLVDAWDIKTKVLNGETIALKLPEGVAEFILTQSQQLGIKCRIEAA